MEGATFYRWPWSVGEDQEKELPSTDGNIQMVYRGSPIACVPQGSCLHVDIRHEDFLPLGCPFMLDGEAYSLFLLPHGVAAKKERSTSSSKEDSDKDRYVSLTVRYPFVFSKDSKGANASLMPRRFRLEAEGAILGSLRDKGPLQEVVLSWMNFFDHCLRGGEDRRSHAIPVPWKNIHGCILDFCQEHAPRRSLILDIAQNFRGQTRQLAERPRRILIRDRSLSPLSKIQEMDSACLDWYIRQPGVTPQEKGAANSGRLKNVVRRETLDTLENRVLKSFLLRCSFECQCYLKLLGKNAQEGDDGKTVASFKRMCSDFAALPRFMLVSALTPGVRPNYVLQSDVRYRRMWEYYRKLLRKEEMEDWAWTWQGKTWSDVVAVLICTALERMCHTRDSSSSLSISPLAQSNCLIRTEQMQGSRMVGSCEPGPFQVRLGSSRRILELVSSSVLGKHHVARDFGQLGASLYLLLKPIGYVGKTISVVAVWPVHTLASTIEKDLDDMVESAARAVQRHSIHLDFRQPHYSLTGIVAVDDSTDGDADFHSKNRVHLAQLAALPTCWEKNIEVLELLLDDLLTGLMKEDSNVWK